MYTHTPETKLYLKVLVLPWLVGVWLSVLEHLPVTERLEVWVRFPVRAHT